MLQEFLNHNFIQIPGDDELTKLRKASSELVKKFTKNKTKLQTFTLIALDPQINASNSDLNEVKKIIIKHWKTFLANSSDTPITVIRAVILEALAKVSNSITDACIIWLSGRNVIKYYKLGRERDLLNNFLLNLGNRIEQKAIEDWSLFSEAKLEKLSNEIGDVASKTAEGIAIIINKAIQGQEELAVPDQSQITENVNKMLVKSLLEVLQKNNVLKMRTQLLWWKEACFSSSLHETYRGLENGLLQVIMAKDYASFVPIVYPISVDYFFTETHRAWTKEAGNDKIGKIKISEFLKLVENSNLKLRNVFSDHFISEERVPIMTFLKGLVWDKYSSKQFKGLVGINPTTEINLDDLTLWIFHDLLIQKALNK